MLLSRASAFAALALLSTIISFRVEFAGVLARVGELLPLELPQAWADCGEPGEPAFGKKPPSTGLLQLRGKRPPPPCWAGRPQPGTASPPRAPAPADRAAGRLLRGCGETGSAVSCKTAGMVLQSPKGGKQLSSPAEASQAHGAPPRLPFVRLTARALGLRRLNPAGLLPKAGEGVLDVWRIAGLPMEGRTPTSAQPQDPGRRQASVGQLSKRLHRWFPEPTAGVDGVVGQAP